MGISGLLPQLKSITRKVQLHEFAGKSAAVDAYGLLHKGSYACARELVEGIHTTRHVDYCMSRVRQFLNAGIRPVLIFDGGRLPTKSDEEASRHRARKEAAEKARRLDAAGQQSAAFEAYQRAVDITPWHARQLAIEAETLGVQSIVAPYEADAQMAYLALTGQVDMVISEDSDMLVYGCPLVLFKLDRAGAADAIALSDLPKNRELNFVNWSQHQFQSMCVMAGCDFLPSLPKVGIKTAHAHMRRSKCFVKAIRYMKMQGSAVPPDYAILFQRALWVFCHQRVYCPLRKIMVHVTPLPDLGLGHGSLVPGADQLGPEEKDMLGPALPDALVAAIACGKVDSMTHQPWAPSLLALVRAPRPASAWARAPPQPSQSGHARPGRSSHPGPLPVPPLAGGRPIGAWARGAPQARGPPSGRENASQNADRGAALAKPTGRATFMRSAAGAAALLPSCPASTHETLAETLMGAARRRMGLAPAGGAGAAPVTRSAPAAEARSAPVAPAQPESWLSAAVGGWEAKRRGARAGTVFDEKQGAQPAPESSERQRKSQHFASGARRGQTLETSLRHLLGPAPRDARGSAGEVRGAAPPASPCGSQCADPCGSQVLSAFGPVVVSSQSAGRRDAEEEAGGGQVGLTPVKTGGARPGAGLEGEEDAGHSPGFYCVERPADWGALDDSPARGAARWHSTGGRSTPKQERTPQSTGSKRSCAFAPASERKRRSAERTPQAERKFKSFRERVTAFDKLAFSPSRADARAARGGR